MMNDETPETKALDEIFEVFHRFGEQPYYGMDLRNFNQIRDLLMAIRQALLNSGRFRLKDETA
jgi:hypothetical protein